MLQNPPRPPQNPPKSLPGRLPNEDRKKLRKGKLWDYRIRGVLATQNRTPAASERSLKRLQNLIHFGPSFLCDFDAILGANKASKIHKNRRKNDAKRRSILGFHF